MKGAHGLARAVALALLISGCGGASEEEPPALPPPPPPIPADAVPPAPPPVPPESTAPSAVAPPAPAPSGSAATPGQGPLQPLPSQAPQYVAPASEDAPNAAQWTATYATGQWVYAADYGWIWVPNGAGTVAVEGAPYVYLYTPTYGWTWYVSPWGFGPYHYGVWVRHPWHPVGWRGGWVAHPSVVVRIGGPYRHGYYPHGGHRGGGHHR